MALSKVKTGQALQIPAEFYNQTVDLLSATRLGAGGFAEEGLGRDRDGVTCLVLNKTGATLNANQVVGITGILQDTATQLGDFLTHVHFTGAVPNRATQHDRFAITQQQIEPDKLGVCVIHGLARCKINMQNETDLFCKPQDGDVTQLRSGDEGQQILWVEPGPAGPGKWALIRISGVGGGGIRACEFRTVGSFTYQQDQFDAHVVDWWQDGEPDLPAQIVCLNTGNGFTAWSSNTYGIAIYNELEGWQCIHINDTRPRFIHVSTQGAWTGLGPHDMTVEDVWDGDNTLVGASVPVVNTGGMFESQNTGVHGVARWDYYSFFYQLVYLDTIGSVVQLSQVFQFRLNADLTHAMDNVEVTPTDAWQGTLPGNPTTVWNTCNMFKGRTNYCGFARWNREDTRYQMMGLWNAQARFINWRVQQPQVETDLTWNVILDEYWDGEEPSQGLGGIIPVINTNNMFRADAAGDAGMARWDDEDEEYQIVYVERPYIIKPQRQARFVIFSATLPFNTSDDFVPAARIAHWEGSQPPATFDVWNTCNMFAAGESQTCGIARWNTTDQRYQIVQLQCEKPSQQAYQTSDLTGFTYSTPTQVPIDAAEFDDGDLTSTSPSGTITFDRDSRGAIRFNLEAYWETAAGSADDETSYIDFELNTGAGWNPIDAGINQFHATYKVTGTDYQSGGTATRSYFTRRIFNAGDQVRLMARTQRGTTKVNLREVALSIEETYSPPIP